MNIDNALPTRFFMEPVRFGSDQSDTAVSEQHFVKFEGVTLFNTLQLGRGAHTENGEFL